VEVSMATVTALLAGESISAQEILVQELENPPRAVMILSIDEDGQAGVTCSGMKVAELALLARVCDEFVGAVVRNHVENAEGENG